MSVDSASSIPPPTFHLPLPLFPKRILVIRLDRIGDVVLSTPVISALRQAYPEARLAMMVRPECRELVEGNPSLDEVIVYDRDGRQHGWWASIRFAWQLRARRFDLAVILHPTNRSHLVPFLAGIRQRVGYDRKFGFLLTRRFPHLKREGLLHERDYCLQLLEEALGIVGTDRRLVVPLLPAYQARITQWLTEQGIHDGDCLVAINPGGAHPSKRWMPERFAAVADGLIDRGIKVVVIAGAADARWAEEVRRAMRAKPLFACGIFGMGELAALLARTRLLISNDSGPVHIAVAVGTPVIAIFGRHEHGLGPRRWGPLGPHDVVLPKDASARTCLRHDDQDAQRCLESIGVDDVLHEAHRLLRLTPSSVSAKIYTCRASI